MIGLLVLLNFFPALPAVAEVAERFEVGAVEVVEVYGDAVAADDAAEGGAAGRAGFVSAHAGDHTPPGGEAGREAHGRHHHPGGRRLDRRDLFQ